jgi:UDP-3-O-[3-hydroxymyristoyl] glucosamine N-acyltransferase
MSKLSDVCRINNIEIAGIIDNDYWGNTCSLSDIPVINGEQCFEDPAQLEHYRKNFNFFCATNWSPENDPATVRNRNKRFRLINLIDQHELNCISLIDPLSRISTSAYVGQGVYIDAFVLIESHCKIHNHSSIYAYTGIGHHTQVMSNCVIQRHCSIAGDCVFEPNTYLGTAVKALKTGATFGEGTFIHEAVYIRRGTVPNEIVGQRGKNMNRVIIL